MITSSVSVIMPNYNHSKYIGTALSAIVSQSFKPLEVIVGDDASTDNSLEVIEDFVKRYSFIHLVRNEKNIGVVNNINKLLQLAKGDYIYGAAADDKILPGFFEKSMKLLEKYPNAGLCSTGAFVMNENGKILRGYLCPIIMRKESYFDPVKICAVVISKGNWITGQTAIYNREYLLENGAFRRELCSFSDTFINQILALKYGACYIPDALVAYRITASTYSFNTMIDKNKCINIINDAENIMRREYEGLFPEEYINKIRNEYMFFIDWNILRNERYRFLKKYKSVLMKRVWIFVTFITTMLKKVFLAKKYKLSIVNLLLSMCQSIFQLSGYSLKQFLHGKKQT